MPRVIEYKLKVQFLGQRLVRLRVTMTIRKLNSGGLNEISKLVIDVLIRIVIKSLQHLDVLDFMEPHDWVALSSLTLMRK